MKPLAFLPLVAALSAATATFESHEAGATIDMSAISPSNNVVDGRRTLLQRQDPLDDLTMDDFTDVLKSVKIYHNKAPGHVEKLRKFRQEDMPLDEWIGEFVRAIGELNPQCQVGRHDFEPSMPVCPEDIPDDSLPKAARLLLWWLEETGIQAGSWVKKFTDLQTSGAYSPKELWIRFLWEWGVHSKKVSMRFAEFNEAGRSCVHTIDDSEDRDYTTTPSAETTARALDITGAQISSLALVTSTSNDSSTTTSTFLPTATFLSTEAAATSLVAKHSPNENVGCNASMKSRAIVAIVTGWIMMFI